MNYNTSGTLQDQDLYNLVHAAAVSRGGGYGRIYNVVLDEHGSSSAARLPAAAMECNTARITAR